MAREIEGDLNSHGREAVMPLDLRAMALRCAETLGKFGKTLDDATEHFVAHLEAEIEKGESATITSLADQWFLDKSTNPNKPLRQDTLDDIEETKNLLQRLFPKDRISEVTKAPIEKYLRGLKVTNRRRYNRKNLIGQFFNWARKHKHTKANPCEEIEIVVPSADVEILTIEECEALLRKCDAPEHADLRAYVCICLFAGLRPTEAQLLKWENVTEKQIKVLGGTSKIKRTRNVPVEPTLTTWLKPIAKKTGSVVPDRFRQRFEALKIAAGYKVQGENEKDGKKWIGDGLRHTYATYWLAKHKDRPHLAENMGTSLKMIADHYKGELKFETEEADFWGLLPADLQAIKDKEAVKAEREAEELDGTVTQKPKEGEESVFDL